MAMTGLVPVHELHSSKMDLGHLVDELAGTSSCLLGFRHEHYAYVADSRVRVSGSSKAEFSGRG